MTISTWRMIALACVGFLLGASVVAQDWRQVALWASVWLMFAAANYLEGRSR